MKIKQLLEGRMKDLWYDIHFNGKPNPFEKKPEPAKESDAPAKRKIPQLAHMAMKAGVPYDTVFQYWKEAQKSIDKKLPGYWANVTAALKKRLKID